MAKFYDVIGYALQTEASSGVWVDTIIERYYRGDVLQNQNRWSPSEGLNDDLALTNRFSIIADPYAYENLSRIKYFRWMGTRWKVQNMEILRPRIIITSGGPYNGPTAAPPTP